MSTVTSQPAPQPAPEPPPGPRRSPWKAAFNPTYLAQALEGCSGDRVRISQADPLKPATLLSGDAAYVYVQMPVRVVGR